jgi:hypothetical protein
MTGVDPDDASPWARDDWTGTESPRLDALTEPGRRAAPRRDDPTAGSDAGSSEAPIEPVVEPRSDHADVPAADDAATGRRLPHRTLVAAAVAVAVVGAMAFGVLRDDGGNDAAPAAAPEVTTAAGDQPTTTLDPVAEELAARDAARTRAAEAERETTEARIGAAGGITPELAVPGQAPPWTDWTIDVPDTLAAITLDTEVVMVTTAGVVHRLELPSGRVRSLIVPEPNRFDWKLALGEREIVLYENRDIVVLRDDRPVQELTTVESLIFLQHWPTTSSYIATSNPSPALEAERALLDVDTGADRPLEPEVVRALPFGAASFLTTGELLVDRPGGTYAIGPDQQPRRIDDGRLRAVGRNHYAVETCDEALRCAQFVVDARGGERTTADLTAIDPIVLVDPSSHVSPDGRRIVLTDSTRATGLRQIVDVQTGARFDVGRLEAIYSPDPWAADGSGIFTEVDGAVVFQRADNAAAIRLDGFGVVAELLVRRR